MLFMLLLIILKPMADVLDQPLAGCPAVPDRQRRDYPGSVGICCKRFVPGRPTVRRASTAAGGPRAPVNYSTRVDKVDPNWQSAQSIRASVTVMLAVLTLIPVVWMGMTAFKSYPDAVASPPKVMFEPTMEGIITLLTKRRQI